MQQQTKEKHKLLCFEFWVLKTTSSVCLRLLFFFLTLKLHYISVKEMMCIYCSWLYFVIKSSQKKFVLRKLNGMAKNTKYYWNFVYLFLLYLDPDHGKMSLYTYNLFIILNLGHQSLMMILALTLWDKNFDATIHILHRHSQYYARLLRKLRIAK